MPPPTAVKSAVNRGRSGDRSASAVGRRNEDLEGRKSGVNSFRQHSARIYGQTDVKSAAPNALTAAILAAGAGSNEEMIKHHIAKSTQNASGPPKFASHRDLLDQVSSRTQEMIHKHIANKLETTSHNAINNLELSSEEHDSLKHLNATSPPKIAVDKYMSSLLPNDKTAE